MVETSGAMAVDVSVILFSEDALIPSPSGRVAIGALVGLGLLVTSTITVPLPSCSAGRL